MKTYFSVALVIVSLFTSCKETKENKVEAAEEQVENDVLKIIEQENEISEDLDSQKYIIKGDGFFGLLAGQTISDKKEVLKKGKLSSGEGDFEVYYIMDNDDKLGYVIPNPKAPSKIGDVVITSEKAVTESGIKIGSTFAEIKEKHPKVVVNGSEMDSQTYATVGTKQFLLDAYFNTYEVDLAKVKPTTKVKQIIATHYSE